MRKYGFIVVFIISVFILTISNKKLYAETPEKNQISFGFDFSINTWDCWLNQLLFPDTDTELTAISAGPIISIKLTNNIIIDGSIKKSSSYLDEADGSISRLDYYIDGFFPLYNNLYGYLSINYFHAEKISNYFETDITITSYSPHVGLAYKFTLDDTVIINPVISITRPFQKVEWYDNTSVSLTEYPGIFAGLVLSHERLTNDNHVLFALRINTEHYKVKVNKEKIYWEDDSYYLPEKSAWDHYYSIGLSASYSFDIQFNTTVRTQDSTDNSYDRY